MAETLPPMIVCAKHFGGLLYQVGLVNVADRHDSERLIIAGIPKCNSLSLGQGEQNDVFLGNVQCDRDREQRSVR